MSGDTEIFTRFRDAGFTYVSIDMSSSTRISAWHPITRKGVTGSGADVPLAVADLVSKLSPTNKLDDFEDIL